MKILTLLFILFVVNLSAQDTINLQNINVIGIKSEERYPITQIVKNTDSVSYLQTQEDPFFVFDKISPSIYSQSDNGEFNGYSYIRIRGLDQTRINFNLNGVPLNEIEDQGIYFSNIPGFYNYISNISIQRGVNTSKYGSTSIAGTVNMESKNMFHKDFKLTTSLIDNTYKSFNNNFLLSSGEKRGFAYQIGASFAKNEGFKQHSDNQGGSIFYGLGHQNKNNVFKLIGFSGKSQNQLAYYGVPMDVINETYNTNLNPIGDKDEFNQNFTSLNWVTSNKYVINSTIYFNNISGDYNASGVMFGVNSYQFGGFSNILVEDEKCIKNIGINVNSYSRYHYGSDMEGYYYDTTRIFKRYHNTGYKKDASIYFKYTQILKKNFEILYDVQIRTINFEIIGETNKTPKYTWLFANPKIGVKYNSWYSTIGYTRREPTRTDMIQNIIQNNNLMGANPDNINVINVFDNLKSENVTDVEIGFKKNINVNLYFMTIKNEFVSTGVIDLYSGFMWKVAVDRTYRYGIESDGNIKIGKFDMFYTFNWQNNKLENKKIPFNPELLSSVGLIKKNAKIEAGVYLQYVGEMAMNYDADAIQNFSNDFLLLNGFFKYKIDNNAYLLFNINNIFNSKYYIPAGVLYNTPTYYVGQLLNYQLSFSYKL